MKLSHLFEEIRHWYHLSDDPNLNPQHDYDVRQGQLGRGLYVTSNPKSWNDTLGKRKYTYKVVNPNYFKIATKSPDIGDKRFVEWAIEKNYMEIRKVVRPNGIEVLDMNDQPMFRPDFTETGKKFLWQDPMTGKKTNDIENEYLKDHGYDGYEPSYSRDGQQIILFNPSKVILKKLKNRSSKITEDDDYKGQHQAPYKESGSPLYDVTKNDIYPEDFYSSNGFRYYADTGEASDSESYSITMNHHNKPNSMVKMYRSVPKGMEGVNITKINPGDWVAISRRYATDHGKSNLRNQYKIISKTVFARDLFTDGNSISEWGYDPQPEIHHLMKNVTVASVLLF
jgi:hypothetical protein